MCGRLTALAVDARLTNPRHVKNLPGRKTDVCDAAWLGQLLECGLLRGSFVPPREIAQLRDLTRYRTKTVRERAREAQRLQKLLEDAGIKLDSVASDIQGVCGPRSPSCARRWWGASTSTTLCWPASIWTTWTS